MQRHQLQPVVAAEAVGVGGERNLGEEGDQVAVELAHEVLARGADELFQVAATIARHVLAFLRQLGEVVRPLDDLIHEPR